MMMASANGSICKKAMKALPLSCLNHISRTCTNLREAEEFYENLLGFVQIKRPGSFDFDGAWLFNYGIGIHLLQSETENAAQEKEIDPRSDHISFQCDDICMVEMKLKENGIKYLRREVEEGGILVDQLFFHDPDNFMIEVCNCDNLPVVPLSRAASGKDQQQFFASCKRNISLSAVIPMPIPMSVPDCVSQNLRQNGSQIGQDYAICG